jgi:hypothetical protein
MKCCEEDRGKDETRSLGSLPADFSHQDDDPCLQQSHHAVILDPAYDNA